MAQSCFPRFVQGGIPSGLRLRKVVIACNGKGSDACFFEPSHLLNKEDANLIGGVYTIKNVTSQQKDLRSFMDSMIDDLAESVFKVLGSLDGVNITGEIERFSQMQVSRMGYFDFHTPLASKAKA
jgi:hypothetical protein